MARVVAVTGKYGTRGVQVLVLQCSRYRYRYRTVLHHFIRGVMMPVSASKSLGIVKSTSSSGQKQHPGPTAAGLKSAGMPYVGQPNDPRLREPLLGAVKCCHHHHRHAFAPRVGSANWKSSTA